MSIVEQSLVALRNDHGDCKHCGLEHPFYTREDKVLLLTPEMATRILPKAEHVCAGNAEVIQEIERTGLAVGFHS